MSGRDPYPALADISVTFPPTGSVWEHLKSGDLYRVTGPGVIEPTFPRLAVGYEPIVSANDGVLERWDYPDGRRRVPVFRDLEEFLDGRFRRVA